jgi:hypothetical protein
VCWYHHRWWSIISQWIISKQVKSHFFILILGKRPYDKNIKNISWQLLFSANSTEIKFTWYGPKSPKSSKHWLNWSDSPILRQLLFFLLNNCFYKSFKLNIIKNYIKCLSWVNNNLSCLDWYRSEVVEKCQNYQFFVFSDVISPYGDQKDTRHCNPANNKIKLNIIVKKF